MKKIKFTGKLSLNKETIAKLNDEQMGSVNGGSYTLHCSTTCPRTFYCEPASANCVTRDGCFSELVSACC